MIDIFEELDRFSKIKSIGTILEHMNLLAYS
jgi:hypothetical protein